MDLRFGTWNVRSLYRTGSLETVESKLAKYNLDVMAVQDVRQGQGW
jgi:exonuclease III